MENNYYPFINLPLPYEYNALEPFIDEKTMRLHHDKHLQTYINNLNDILKECTVLRKLSLEQLIRKSSELPDDIQSPVRNNAGGVYNHRFFFNGLTPFGSAPAGRLERAISGQFGGFDKFRVAFKAAALSVFGSGYAWLVKDGCRLRIVTTANQNSPIEQSYRHTLCSVFCPILCVDVWEHAYYLKHYNVRADYIDDWFNVIDWARAEALYTRG